MPGKWKNQSIPPLTNFRFSLKTQEIGFPGAQTVKPLPTVQETLGSIP